MGSHYDQKKGITAPQLSDSDWEILNSYRDILPGLVLAFGQNTTAALYSAEDDAFLCVAAENGQVDQIEVGAPLEDFASDAVSDEAGAHGKNTIGIYYSRTQDNRSLKCVINIIRNKFRTIIGVLCVRIDVSIPLHEFMRGFIPVVDNNLANGISDEPAPLETVEEMCDHLIDQAISNANDNPQLSTTDRNRFIVQQLNTSGIFNIRGSISLVANELGVSRYTIYNYLKASPAGESPEE